MKTQSKLSLAFVAAAVALAFAPAAHSQTQSFSVDISTAGLSSESADAPFFLDLQLNYGNVALASNSITLSNFTFTGGTTIGPDVTNGLVSGSLASSAVITANSAHPFSELYQEFSSGVTDIKFSATVTETGPDIGTPTEFAAAILDSSLGFPAQLYTTAPDTASLVTLDLSSSNTFSDIHAYSSVSSADGSTPVSGVSASVPDATSTLVLVAGAVLFVAVLSRRSSVLAEARSL